MTDEERKEKGLLTEEEARRAANPMYISKRPLMVSLKKLGEWYVIIACIWLGYTLIDLVSMRWGIPGWHTVAYLFTNGMFGFILLLPLAYPVNWLPRRIQDSRGISVYLFVVYAVAVGMFLVGSGMDLYYDAVSGKFQVATIIDGSRYID